MDGGFSLGVKSETPVQAMALRSTKGITTKRRALRSTIDYSNAVGEMVLG